MRPLTRPDFIALRRGLIAGAHGYDTAALCAMQTGDYADARSMAEHEADRESVPRVERNFVRAVAGLTTDDEIASVYAPSLEQRRREARRALAAKKRATRAAELAAVKRRAIAAHNARAAEDSDARTMDAYESVAVLGRARGIPPGSGRFDLTPFPIRR